MFAGVLLFAEEAVIGKSLVKKTLDTALRRHVGVGDEVETPLLGDAKLAAPLVQHHRRA